MLGYAFVSNPSCSGNINQTHLVSDNIPGLLSTSYHRDSIQHYHVPYTLVAVMYRDMCDCPVSCGGWTSNVSPMCSAWWLLSTSGSARRVCLAIGALPQMTQESGSKTEIQLVTDELDSNPVLDQAFGCEEE